MFNFSYAHCHLDACKWSKWQMMFLSKASVLSTDSAEMPKFIRISLTLKTSAKWMRRRLQMWRQNLNFHFDLCWFFRSDWCWAQKKKIYKYFSSIFFFKYSQSHAKVKLFLILPLFCSEKKIFEPRIHMFLLLIWVVSEIFQRSSATSTSHTSYMYDSDHSYPHTQNKIIHFFLLSAWNSWPRQRFFYSF